MRIAPLSDPAKSALILAVALLPLLALAIITSLLGFYR
jgi:hypothetical protein